jgi:hypothetical protein
LIAGFAAPSRPVEALIDLLKAGDHLVPQSVLQSSDLGPHFVPETLGSNVAFNP